MKIQYIDKNFREEAMRIIAFATIIIDEYQAQGFTLTLRQLYYQFVARDIIANKVSEYTRLGTIISNARLAGLIDWDAIEDRTRNLQKLSTWNTPADILESAQQSYRIDLRENQSSYIEVWIEKEALAGVFEKVCNEYRMPFFSCRGYVSQSEMHEAAKRLERKALRGQTPYILHFGDHDPSGIDMTRDIKDRLNMFVPGFRKGWLNVERCALNMDQIEQYSPPPNPAKESDTRFASYLQEYGDESYELDALNPTILANLVTKKFNEHVDEDEWNDDLCREDNGKDRIQTVIDNFRSEEQE